MASEGASKGASEGRDHDRSDAGRDGADIVVIGGGVTGLSAAWWLARDGADVLVLERGIVGWEASGRNGGGCSHHYSPLFREEQRLWPRLDELLGYPTEFRPGRVRIALDDRQVAINERGLANARHQGFAGERIDQAQLRELVPIAGDDVAAAYLWHFGGHANPQRTAQAYAWATEDLGGRIRQHATVHRIETRGDRAVAVLTDRGRIACGMVIVAAGPQTGALVAPLGVRLPLAPARAEILVTEPLPALPIGGTDGNGLYGRQTLRGNLVYGGGPHEWLDEADAGSAGRWGRAPTSTLTRDIAGRLAALFPRAAHARVIRSWAGYVENTPDGRPVIDRLAEPANVIVATMSSVGFGLSPAAGRAIRDLALDGRCGFADISGFRLSRFANLPADWRERYGWLPPDAPPDATTGAGAGAGSYQGIF